MTRDEELCWLARKLRYVREVPENKGQRVEAMQRWSGGVPGDSWCAFFVSLILDVVYEGKAPLPRTGSCDVLLETARSKGWLSQTPHVGDLYLVLRSPTDAHHVGVVTRITGPQSVLTISGNTNTDGSDNGNGVYEKEVHYTPGKIVFVSYPRS